MTLLTEGDILHSINGLIDGMNDSIDLMFEELDDPRDALYFIRVMEDEYGVSMFNPASNTFRAAQDAFWLASEGFL